MKIFMTYTTLLKKLRIGVIMLLILQMKVKTYKVLLETGHKPKKLKILFLLLNISLKVLKVNLSLKNLVTLDILLKLKQLSIRLMNQILIMLTLITMISLKLVSILNKLVITLMLLKELTGNTVYLTYTKNL